MNKGIILLEDAFTHHSYCDSIVEGLFDTIETFNKREEASFEGSDVVYRVNASFAKSK